MKLDMQKLKETGKEAIVQITGKEVIIQDNRLLEAPKTLSVQESKLFLFLISKIDQNDYNTQIFRIYIKELAEIISINTSQNIYRDTRNIVKKLMNRTVSLDRHENGIQRTMDMQIISYADYCSQLGFVDIKISDEIFPYLIDLNKQFTQYKLSQIIGLSSIYAIRIYELLKQYESIGSRTFFLDDIRKKLNIPKTKIIANKDFKKIVLEIAQREINDKTDISIDYKFIKTGRKFTSIQFNINSKNQKQIESNNMQYHNPDDYQERRLKMLCTIVQFGFTQKKADSLSEHLTDDELEDAIAAINDQIKKKNTRNIKATVMAALQGKWSAPLQETKNNNKVKEIGKIIKNLFN